MIFANVTLVHIADTLEQLDADTETLLSVGRKYLCQFAVLRYQQEDGLNTVLPYGLRRIKAIRTLTTESASALMPFRVQDIQDAGGIYYGVNSVTHNLILCNRKQLLNGGGFIAGVSGSGKSMAAKGEVINIALASPEDDILIVDPDGEYAPLVRALGGTVLKVSANSPNHINAMAINADYAGEDDPVMLKSEFVLSLCDELMGSGRLGPQEKSILDRCVALVYQDYLRDYAGDPPTLRDLHAVLLEQPEQEAQSIALALELFTKGSLNIFAHQTNVDLQNHCICFNTVKLGKSMQSIGMMTVLDQIWNRITRNRVLGRRTWIFTDEFQLLLGNSACTNYYFELSSRARKWGAILTSITQHVRSVLNNEDARRMLSDCGYIKLLNQAPDDANDIARLLHISDEEKRYIENAEVGSGLLIADKVVVPFNNTFPQDTELFCLMDTNPNRKK